MYPYASTYSGVPCPYCSSSGVQAYHYGVFPKVKEIEYHPDGTVKKVVFKDDTDWQRGTYIGQDKGVTNK